MARETIPQTGATSLFDNTDYWDGETLNLNGGTYTGSYTLPAGKSIVGPGYITGQVILSEATSISALGIESLRVFHNNCKIKNILLEWLETGNCYNNGFKDIQASNYAILNKVLDSTFENFTVTGTSLNLKITGCKRVNFNIFESHNGAIGIKAYENEDLEFKSSLINSGGTGILAFDNKRIKFEKCKVQLCTKPIIFESNKDSNSLEGCIISDNVNSIRITKCENTLLTNTKVKNTSNDTGIVLRECVNPSLSSNTITYCNGHGIELIDCTNVKSANNTTKLNKKYGIKVTNCTGSSFASEKVAEQKPYGMYIQGSSKITGSNLSFSRCNNTAVYIEDSSQCIITLQADLSDYGVHLNNCQDSKVIDSTVTNCKIGLINQNGSNNTVSGTTISGCSLIIPVYEVEGEYEKCNLSKALFHSELPLMKRFSAGILDWNSEATLISDCDLFENYIGVFEENSDNFEMYSNRLLENENGVIVNKCKKGKIIDNWLLLNTNNGLVLHSNLSWSSKIDLDNRIENNIISRGRLFTVDGKYYLPEYLIPNEAYYLRLKESLNINSKVIKSNNKINIQRAYWEGTEYLNQASKVYVEFLDDYLQHNGTKPLLLEKQSLSSFLLADSYKNSLYAEYDIFVFSDAKENFVLSNFTNSVYLNNVLENSLKTADSDNWKAYEYKKTLETLVRNPARELREASKLNEDKLSKQAVQLYLAQNTMADEAIATQITDPIEKRLPKSTLLDQPLGIILGEGE